MNPVRSLISSFFSMNSGRGSNPPQHTAPSPSVGPKAAQAAATGQDVANPPSPVPPITGQMPSPLEGVGGENQPGADHQLDNKHSSSSSAGASSMSVPQGSSGQLEPDSVPEKAEGKGADSSSHGETPAATSSGGNSHSELSRAVESEARPIDKVQGSRDGMPVCEEAGPTPDTIPRDDFSLTRVFRNPGAGRVSSYQDSAFSQLKDVFLLDGGLQHEAFMGVKARRDLQKCVKTYKSNSIQASQRSGRGEFSNAVVAKIEAAGNKLDLQVAVQFAAEFRLARAADKLKLLDTYVRRDPTLQALYDQLLVNAQTSLGEGVDPKRLQTHAANLDDFTKYLADESGKRGRWGEARPVDLQIAAMLGKVKYHHDGDRRYSPISAANLDTLSPGRSSTVTPAYGTGFREPSSPVERYVTVDNLAATLKELKELLTKLGASIEEPSVFRKPVVAPRQHDDDFESEAASGALAKKPAALKVESASPQSDSLPAALVTSGSSPTGNAPTSTADSAISNPSALSTTAPLEKLRSLGVRDAQGAAEPTVSASSSGNNSGIEETSSGGSLHADSSNTSVARSPTKPTAAKEIPSSSFSPVTATSAAIPPAPTLQAVTKIGAESNGAPLPAKGVKSTLANTSDHPSVSSEELTRDDVGSFSRAAALTFGVKLKPIGERSGPGKTPARSDSKDGKNPLTENHVNEVLKAALETRRTHIEPEKLGEEEEESSFD